MPVAQGLLALASALTGRDLYAEGRTLENLGLSALSRADMRALLQEAIEIAALVRDRRRPHGTGHRRVYLIAGLEVSLIDLKPRAADEQARVHDAARVAVRAELGMLARLGVLSEDQADAALARLRLRARTMRPPTCARRARCSRPCPNAWTPSVTRCAGWTRPARPRPSWLPLRPPSWSPNWRR